MKRRTKKVKAKLALLDIAKRDAILEERKKVAELMDTIDNLDLSRVLAQFVLAKQQLDRALEEIEKDVTPFLPDDSDF